MLALEKKDIAINTQDLKLLDETNEIKSSENISVVSIWAGLFEMHTIFTGFFTSLLSCRFSVCFL